MIPARTACAFIWSVALSASCAPRDGSVIDRQAEMDTVRKLHEAWFAAEGRRDVDASLAVLAPDIVFQPAGAPPVTGLEAARQLYQEFFALPYTSLTGQVTRVDIAAAGDLAYDLGTWAATLDSPQGPVELKGKFMAVFRKTNGQWRVVANSYSTDSQ